MPQEADAESDFFSFDEGRGRSAASCNAGRFPLWSAAMRKILIIACMLVLAACGSVDPYSPNVVTDLPPTVTRVDPTTGPAGTRIQVFGFGFSVAAPENIVIIGNSAVAAETYDLVVNPTSDEIEVLTATVPNDVELGDASIVVVVGSHTSNADVLFTVTP